MDKNFTMELREDKKFKKKKQKRKTRPRADKMFEKWDLKSVGPTSPSRKRAPNSSVMSHLPKTFGARLEIFRFHLLVWENCTLNKLLLGPSPIDTE